MQDLSPVRSKCKTYHPFIGSLILCLDVERKLKKINEKNKTKEKRKKIERTVYYFPIIWLRNKIKK